MANATKSIGARLCILISFISVLYTLYAALDPIYTLSITGRFLLAAAFILPLGLASILIAHQMPNERAKQQVYHIFWWILFVYYLLQMIYMLFFASEFARQNTPLFDGNYFEHLKQQWEVRCNLKPFDTINLMRNAYENDMHHIAIVNILGNIVAFMPFAFFLPKLFPSMKKSKRFLGFMCLLVIFVEVTQFLTMSGTMDIDDFILNIGGTSIFYFLLKLPLCNRLIVCHKTVPFAEHS